MEMILIMLSVQCLIDKLRSLSMRITSVVFMLAVQCLSVLIYVTSVVLTLVVQCLTRLKKSKRTSVRSDGLPSKYSGIAFCSHYKLPPTYNSRGPGIGFVQTSGSSEEKYALPNGTWDQCSEQPIVDCSIPFGDVPLAWEGFLERDIKLKQRIQNHMKSSILRLESSYEAVKNTKDRVAALRSVYAMKLQWHEDMVKYIELLQEEAKSSDHCEWIAEQIKHCESDLAKDECINLLQQEARGLNHCKWIAEQIGLFKSVLAEDK